MKTFTHVSAETIDQATSILDEYGADARIIAGGTDLLGEMKDGILPDTGYPKVLVNIKGIRELDYVREEEGNLRVGALTRLEDLAADENVRSRYPALAEAAHRTASPHIREMGTVAGNICQNNRCWYYWAQDNLFECLRKGGGACYALTGDSRYHSIYGAARVNTTACRRACPNSIDIPTYLGKIREGDGESAATILLQRNPIPAITGRVCPHWCEQDCARGEFDEAVSVREVERFLGDQILDHASQYYGAPRQATGKKVAVIGSGPAGLSAAYYLRQAGHEVTVFETMPEAGGMLAYGIPPYRLPREVLRKQVQAIADTGVDIKVGTRVDGAKFEELVKSYDAVFVAGGASQESQLGIAGEECLMSATEFLRNVYERPQDMAGKTVGVIGGGNTAIDVARSLLRLGAHPVIYYRRTKDEMPALEEEIEKAEEEGVRFEFLTQPVGASADAGPAGEPSGVSLTCCRMELTELDASGRPRPVKVEGSEFAIQCDAVMKAIVERPDYSFLPAGFVDERGRLKIDTATHSLGKGLFAGGDFVTGPATVAEAVGAGREAAMAVTAELMGVADRKGDSGERGPRYAAVGEETASVCGIGERFSRSCLEPSSRVQVPELSLTDKVKSLHAEETGTLEASAVETEANRCFNCGCVAVNSSDLAPALVALGAKVRTTQRVIDAEDFFSVGVNTSTILGDDEIVLEVEVPRPAPGTKSAFIKFALRRSIDFPVVNCAAAITTDNGLVRSARICLNSVCGVPLRISAAEAWLVGKPADQTSAEAAADAAVSDSFAFLSNKYKIQIARALVKRAVLACS